MHGGRGVLEASYVVGVTAIAGWGFVTDSTAAILAALVLTLPCGLLAIVAYYLAYGLLALAPGANPSSSSGSGSCSPDSVCVERSSGDLAPWLEVTTDLIGVALVVVAACANVALLRSARRKVS